MDGNFFDLPVDFYCNLKGIEKLDNLQMFAFCYYLPLLYKVSTNESDFFDSLQYCVDLLNGKQQA